METYLGHFLHTMIGQEGMVGDEMLPTLVKQTALRSTVLVIGKCIGLVGRVVLTRMLGAEGIGLYQIVYSFFGMILLILTGGLPTALALFTAKQPARGWVVFQYTSFLMGGIGATVAYLVYGYASNIASVLGHEVFTYGYTLFGPSPICSSAATAVAWIYAGDKKLSYHLSI